MTQCSLLLTVIRKLGVQGGSCKAVDLNDNNHGCICKKNLLLNLLFSSVFLNAVASCSHLQEFICNGFNIWG